MIPEAILAKISCSETGCKLIHVNVTIMGLSAVVHMHYVTGKLYSNYDIRQEAEVEFDFFGDMDLHTNSEDHLWKMMSTRCFEHNV